MLFTGISLYRGDSDCGIIEKNVKKGIGMHLFLTGDIRIGKSTLIGKLLEQVDGSVKGFKTVSVPGEKESESDIYILPPEGGPEGCGPGNRIIHRDYIGQTGPAVFPEVFDGYGCDLLKHTEGAALLLMDEIGIMEAKSPAFQEAVRKCIEGDIPILGVVRNKPNPFLDWVRNHPKVKVKQVTLANRDKILPELSELLKQNMERK